MSKLCQAVNAQGFYCEYFFGHAGDHKYPPGRPDNVHAPERPPEPFTITRELWDALYEFVHASDAADERTAATKVARVAQALPPVAGVAERRDPPEPSREAVYAAFACFGPVVKWSDLKAALRVAYAIDGVRAGGPTALQEVHGLLQTVQDLQRTIAKLQAGGPAREEPSGEAIVGKMATLEAFSDKNEKADAAKWNLLLRWVERRRALSSGLPAPEEGT